MLRLERVSKFYSAGGLVSTGFSKVDLEFHMGEFVAITGESGSGKSTLLNVISGLDAYEEGEMYVMEEPTSGYAKEDLEAYRKKYIGNIFQSFNLINSYTVYQNVELVLLLSGYHKEQVPARVQEILEKVGLSGFEKKKASKLSGGQKQRVAIARALAKETPIIVADEPTGNLDSQSAAEIIKLLHELSKDKLIIIVTHNYEQVEPYVTRKITMHDGRVVEDKTLQTSLEKEEQSIKPAKADALSVSSQIRLGLRNTFNIPAKFVLLSIVFLFLCCGVISMYATTQNMGDAMGGGWNDYFIDTSEKRILVTKKDRSEFSEKDYEKLASIDNVERIVENDLSLDLITSVTDHDMEGTFWISAVLREVELYADQLTEGRLPENEREAVFMIPSGGYADDCMADAMDKEVMVIDDYTGNQVLRNKIDIVGYGYLTAEQNEAMEDSGYYCEGYLCVNDAVMDQVRMVSLEKYCTQEIEFADNVLEGNSANGTYPIYQSDFVPEGEVYIPEEIADLSMYSAYGQELKLTNKSLYFEDMFSYTVGASYNKENCYYYLGIENYDEINNSALYVNPKDYGEIFDKENYQSSVITIDKAATKDTAREIEEAGYQTFVVSEGLASYSEDIDPVYDIFRALMLFGVLIVLFFITYFIVKLILKSRNIYFSTIRMLGATKENVANLLKLELVFVYNIAFAAITAFVVLIKTEVLQIETVTELATYLGVGDFVILYILLGVMTLLLAMRYAKQLFKQTAMDAYKEEV